MLEKTEALYTELRERLNSQENCLQDRFRALFTLKSLSDTTAIDIIAECFKDPSVLLKHELAYVLGQMKNEHAIPVLNAVLNDTNEDVMVRHEAGEALGAIGSLSSLPLLEKYLNDDSTVIAETCQLSYERIKRLHDPSAADHESLVASPRTDLPFISVDPAVGDDTNSDIAALEEKLLDASKFSLYERYRAMFSLRNINSRKAVLALSRGFADKSELFRHEIAYVLGQLADPASIPALAAQLAITDEHPMVRHECAEALGAIATQEANDILSSYLNDPERVVKESVVVALDILDYEQSSSFQYATVKQMKEEQISA